MNLDNDPDLFDTLMKKLRNGGSIHYYRRLIIMNRCNQMSNYSCIVIK